MTYGLYLSATGVLTNSLRQDVIANNLANSETVGFKRDLPLFAEMLTEARMRRLDPARHSNPVLENLGGGLRVLPTATDLAQGEMESTGNPLDVAIHGEGFFAVCDARGMHLTRSGQFIVDRAGRLTLASGGQQVLDEKARPITLDSSGPVSIGNDGRVSQNGQEVARIGLFTVPSSRLLSKRGAGLLDYPQLKKNLRPAAPTLRSGFLERSNVEPATELSQLMDAHRQLEANANMIRYQDQMLSRLMNDVGKIG
jgi:flagellar basal body rod protein FlgG